jgi:PEP-CTERM motif-containing protein
MGRKFHQRMHLGGIAGVVAAAMCLLGAWTTASADDYAYATEDGGNFGTIDLNTGVYSNLGSSGQDLAGLALENGTLFGSSYEAGTGSLYSVNRANGTLTLVGTSSVDYYDFGSTTTGLYSIDTSGNLYSINATTGAATLIGATGLAHSGWNNLSSNASSLYFANGTNFYTINTSTGAATLIGGTGGQQLGALTAVGGTLFGGENSPSLAVATVNVLTGFTTTGAGVTGTGAAAFFGIAAAVPEPSTSLLMLAGLGVVALGARRRISQIQ